MNKYNSHFKKHRFEQGFFICRRQMPYFWQKIMQQIQNSPALFEKISEREIIHIYFEIQALIANPTYVKWERGEEREWNEEGGCSSSPNLSQIFMAV